MSRSSNADHLDYVAAQGMGNRFQFFESVFIYHKSPPQPE
jgi:hypothetical protein